MGTSYTYLRAQLNRWLTIDPRSIDWKQHVRDGQYLVLGIDEHSQGKRRYALTITNITQRRLITILPDARQRTLERFLRSIPSSYRRHIRYVTMDFTNRYKTVVQRWLKWAEIVPDHFHLIRLANDVLWKEKRIIESMQHTKVKYFRLLLKAQERLTPEQYQHMTVLLRQPYARSLKKAYVLKETIRTIMQMHDIQQATQAFRQLTNTDVWNKRSTPRSELLQYSRSYRSLIETLQRWRQPILNFLKTRLSNAFTEGVHTKIKLLKRMSYGIPNTTVYIKKMVLAFHAPQITHHY